MCKPVRSASSSGRGSTHLLHLFVGVPHLERSRVLRVVQAHGAEHS
jgi:hypothetical protein